jgi:hypothetical protein
MLAGISDCGREYVQEEGEQPLSDFGLEVTGSNAHAAGHIQCVVGETNGLPHGSTHTPGLVNWGVGFACNGGIVFDLTIRLALYCEGEEISETGYMEKGDTALAKQTVQSTCIPGWYTGWYQIFFTLPAGYVGKSAAKGWSKASQCEDCE